MSRLQVLLASRSKLALEGLAPRIEEHGGFAMRVRHIENGHADPLYGLDYVPDVVVLVMFGDGHADLEQMADISAASRPPMIVAVDKGDAQTMRLAMQAGARDFLPGVVTSKDIIDSIDRLTPQLVDRENGEHQLTVFINTKGGSGSTFLAANVAHLSQSASKRRTALLNLDLQFETLSQLFDVKIRHSLLEVLDSVERLDRVALDAFMTEHDSGLRLLAAQEDPDLFDANARAGELGLLIEKLVENYEHVVIDLPRRIDALALQALLQATKIVLVTQQTLPHLRDAKKLMKVLSSHEVPTDQVMVVVNRHDSRAAITVEDIGRTLKGVETFVIPSDFNTVTESINLGVPMLSHARSSAVTKALRALDAKLSGVSPTASGGFFGKALSSILRKDSWS